MQITLCLLMLLFAGAVAVQDNGDFAADPDVTTVRPADEPATRPGSADAIGDQKVEHFEKPIEVVMKLDYLLSLPEGYDEQDRQWPVVVFLHGAGERGDDVQRVATWGVPRLIGQGKKIPAIVVSPQCSARSWWTDQVPALSALLDEIEANYRVDKSRIYLTGMSMGGYGSFAWAAAEPERFAAVAPVCGGGSEDSAKAIADLPIWIFHGTEDPTVPVSQSTDMYRWIKAAGGEQTKMTLYEGVDHISWTHAYADENLWTWMFEQQRED